MHALDVPHRRLHLPALLLAAGLTIPLFAQATASATGSVTRLRVQLLDLDGAGGSTPSISFAGGLSISDVERLSIPANTISGTWDTGIQTMTLGFVLGAHTGVRFTVDYAITARTELRHEFAGIGVVFATGDFSVGDYSTWTPDDYGIDWTSAWDGRSDTHAGSFSVASLNQGSGLYTRYLGVGGQSYGTSVSAVPEPENYAMFLAGLAVLGALVRRRALH